MLIHQGCGCHAHTHTGQAHSQGTQSDAGIEPPPGLPNHMLAVEAKEVEWERIPVTVDSGAVDTVGPTSAGQLFPIEQTEDSKAGQFYRATNGKPIKNYGQRKITGTRVRERPNNENGRS